MVSVDNADTHTHTHTYIYIYSYIFIYFIIRDMLDPVFSLPVFLLEWGFGFQEHLHWTFSIRLSAKG
jgi:hypothetical protein